MEAAVDKLRHIVAHVIVAIMSDVPYSMLVITLVPLIAEALELLSTLDGEYPNRDALARWLINGAVDTHTRLASDGIDINDLVETVAEVDPTYRQYVLDRYNQNTQKPDDGLSLFEDFLGSIDDE